MKVRHRRIQMKRLVFGLVVASLVGGGVVWATAGSSFGTSPFVRSTGGARIKLKTHPNTLNDVLVQKVSADVGGYSGWHSHPGFGIVAVKSGTIAIYDAEDPTCTPTYYGPGEEAGAVYTEEADHVHFARNEGTVPFEAYATFVLPVGVPGRTDEPAPGNCPF